MKRILSVLTVLLLICAVLGGCGKKAESNEPPAATTPTTPTTFATQPPATTEPPQEVVRTFTVHASVPDEWGTPGLWPWSDTEGNAFEAWPGERMRPEGDGWYCLEVPEWVSWIVVNGQGGAVQTVDLDIESREVWVGVGADGTLYLEYEKFEMPPEGYIAQLEGQWESVYLSDGNSRLNVYAMVFPETVQNCYEMTVNMLVEMNAGTSCKDWNVWLRIGGTFEKVDKLYLEAGGGEHSQTISFAAPISFDAIVITPTIPGGYSWSMALSVTDVWTAS